MLRLLRHAAFSVLACASLLAAAPLAARQATATLALSVKNSSTYAQATPVPLQAALLIVTPSWAGTNFKTIAGGSEVPGQTLFMSELVVALSSRKADCESVFALGAPDNDKDFLIVAGKAEAYLPRREWKSTSAGRTFADNAAEKDKNHLEVERFSVSVLGGGLKKPASKDGLGGANRLVLNQSDGKWTADIALKVDDVVAEGKVPLMLCGIENRSRNQMPPLLGEHRMTNAARAY